VLLRSRLAPWLVPRGQLPRALEVLIRFGEQRLALLDGAQGAREPLERVAVAWRASRACQMITTRHAVVIAMKMILTSISSSRVAEISE
jgi:hypothetical protein